jgi:hypothetical protein
MRLGLFYYGSAPDTDAACYLISPAIDNGELYRPEYAEYEYLLTMMPRIEQMAKKVLNYNFFRLGEDKLERSLELYVRKGTSTGRGRFDFRAFAGWVSLHDFESPQPDSETNEKIGHIVRESMGYRVGTVENWPATHSGRSK